MNMVTIPTGITGYLELPFTNMKQPLCRVLGSNTLIHSVVHAYHPVETEQISVNYQDMTQTNTSSEVHHIDFYKNSIFSKTVCNIEASQKPTPRMILPLPHSTEELQFLTNIHLQYSDLNDSDYTYLCKLLVENKHCYVKHRNNVGKLSTPFRISLKPYAKLQTHGPTKLPVPYRKNLIIVLNDSQKTGTLKQIGSTPHEKPNYGTKFRVN